MAKIKVEIELDDEVVASALSAGFEGGVGYWCRIYEYVDTAGKRPTFFGSSAAHMTLPLTPDGAVLLYEHNDGEVCDGDITGASDPRIHRLDAAAIKRGLETMSQASPHQFANLINQEGDSDTGDHFIQCCVLGKLVYG